MAAKKKLAKAAYISHAFKRQDELKHIDVEGPRLQRAFWARPWLLARKNDCSTVYPEIETDTEKFKATFRMDLSTFELIFRRIEGRITKIATNMRQPIPPRVRLQVALRYLTSGCSFKVLEEAFRISSKAIALIVPQVCDAIWQEFAEEEIRSPQTQQEWLEKAKVFDSKWNYPFSLGALDGKHCLVKSFGNSGSLFYSYKQDFSVLLLALVDAEYRFMYVDIGAPGGSNDSGVMKVSNLQSALDNGNLNLPVEKHPLGVDYHFIGDDAFGFTTRLVKPYLSRGLTAQQRIFNYRFSWTRRVVENAFGIMSSKFRVLRTANHQNYENCVKTIKAVTVLHNLLLKPHEIITADAEGSSYENCSIMDRIQSQCGNRTGTTEARDQRDKMAQHFFSGQGQVPFQWE
ncbi:uncharacterized protein LOC131893283 [Tigriopus californicus]|uniref:uncharacterized protein LOC131893283 n=1 Tax=Tigriopus californicus TaxID=6832 RepID=UPI0027DA9240|nr:uncharacterized protein LOC131893283 [Tigriopus californicus]